MTSVAAAILAAGRGSRLHTEVPKPLLELDGRALAEWSLDAARAGGASPILLVVGRHRRAVAGRAPADVATRTSWRWRSGIAQSVRVAVRWCQGLDGVTALCIGLADQPLVGGEAYRRLIDADARGAQLAVATYEGERGNPVLIGRDLWPEAGRLRGDVGARSLMATHDVVEVDCTGTGDPSDVDTLDDLRTLGKALRPRSEDQ